MNSPGDHPAVCGTVALAAKIEGTAVGGAKVFQPFEELGFGISRYQRDVADSRVGLLTEGVQPQSNDVRLIIDAAGLLSQGFRRQKHVADEKRQVLQPAALH